jgi:hypothetical protein
MQRLVDFTVEKGETKGRVRLTLETKDGKFQAWLDRKQAEQLGADIFACRFQFKGLVMVIQPPKLRTKPTEIFISFATTMPRELSPASSVGAE